MLSIPLPPPQALPVSAPEPPALPPGPSLLAAEWAFVRHAERDGISPAFLAVLHPDAIVFRPGPVNGPEAFRARPASGSLAWYPAISEVAASGDLGFNAGPSEYRASPATPLVRHGWFASLWRRSGKGSWQLLIDMGIGCPPPSEAAPALPEIAGRPAPLTGPLLPAPRVDELLALDRAFGSGPAESGLPGSGLAGRYRAHLRADARLFREGESPFLGWEAIRSLLAREEAAGMSRWEPRAAFVSAAGDLACSYGLVTRWGAAQRNSRSNYLRFWTRRTPAESWRLALEMETPLPASP